MDSPRPLVHIGYVKTGSTYLQQFILDNQKAGLMQVAERGRLTLDLIQPYIPYYDVEVVKSHVQPRMEAARAASLTPVITHERLSGNPISGGYDATILADRLFELFPYARVLVIVREQVSMMESIYNEYVNGGGACSLWYFISPPEGAKLPLFDLRFLEFHRLIGYYRKLFGPENVLVLPFEFFQVDALGFCSRIISWVGGVALDSVPDTRVRASKRPLTVWAEHHLNRFFFRDNSNPAAPFHFPELRQFAKFIGQVMPESVHRRVQAKMAELIESKVGGRYVESNRITQDFTDFDLSEFGYML